MAAKLPIYDVLLEPLKRAVSDGSAQRLPVMSANEPPGTRYKYYTKITIRNAMHYKDVFEHYRNKTEQDPDLSKSDDIIHRVYRASYKVGKNGRVLQFITPQQSYDIFYIKSLSQKHKDICPNGLFVCTNSDDRNKTLHFVYPLENKGKLFGQHIHTYAHTKKNVPLLGLHETRYGVDVENNTTGFVHHLLCHQLDPIILPADDGYTSLDAISFSKCDYRISDRRQQMIQDVLRHPFRNHTQTGGAKRRINNERNRTFHISFHSKKMWRLFKNWHTGYGKRGIRELHVFGIKQHDGSYVYQVYGIPGTRQYYDAKKRYQRAGFAIELNPEDNSEMSILRELYKLSNRDEFKYSIIVDYDDWVPDIWLE